MVLYFWRYIIPDAYHYTEQPPYYQCELVIDNATSVIWCERYQEPGEISLLLRATPELLEFFWELGMLVTRDDSDRAMRVERLVMTTSSDGGDHIRITGRSAESFTRDRAIMQRGRMYRTPTDLVNYLIRENLGSYWYYHTDESHQHGSNNPDCRRYFNLFVEGESDIDDGSRFMADDAFGRNLGEVVTEYCNGNAFGFKAIFDGEKLVYSCYRGQDRTLNQSDRNPVIFADDFRNIGDSEYTRSRGEYYSHVIAGGAGSGSERVYSDVYKNFRSPAGIGGNMRETFINASGAASDTLSGVASNALLAAHETYSMTAEAVSGGQYKYREHYFLGDRVSVVNRYGLDGTATVAEVVETEDANGYYCVPTLTDFDTSGYISPERPDKPEPPPVPEHYGIRWAKDVADPRGRCEYLYDCEGWTPMQCQSDGTVDRGSWTDDSAFFLRKNYPCMVWMDGTEDYRLDPEDHTKKLDGSQSDAANESYNGNAMSCFDCHIWVKFFEDENYQGFEVANYQVDEDFVDWPYIRADGSHAEKMYYPMFEGQVIDGKLRSIGTGQRTNYTRDYTLSESQALAQANDGAGAASVWSVEDWSHRLWITLLAMLVGKTTCVEMALGQGNTGGSSYSSYGALMDAGAFWGKPANTSISTRNSYPVKMFYCENIYGNIYKLVLGLYNAEGVYYARTCPPYTADGVYSSYTNCGALPEKMYGYEKDLRITPCGFLPATAGVIGTGYDKYLGAQIQYAKSLPAKIAVFSGSRSSGLASGAWYMYLEIPPTSGLSGSTASLILMQPG